MKVSLLKKLGAVVCCAAVLCSSMLMGASAANNKVNLKNLVLYPTPESKKSALMKEDEAYTKGFLRFDDGNLIKKPDGSLDTENPEFSPSYVVEATGTAAVVNDDKDYRFADGNSFVTYKLPLKKGEKKAKVVLTLAAGYKVWKSDENKFTEDDVVATAGGETGTGNKGDIVVDVQDLVDAGKDAVYIRVGDDTPNGGNGGQVFRVALIYGEYESTTEPPLEAPTEAKNFEWTAGTALEKSYVYKAAGQFSVDMYFMDRTEVRYYKIPYDDSKDSTLSMELGQDYKVYMSNDDKNYEVVAENDAEKNGTGKGNRRIYSFSLNKYKNTGADYIYVAIGDRDVSDGNGGCIWYMKFNFGNDSGLYNPFVSTNAAYQAPGKVSATGKPVEASSKPPVVSSEPEQVSSEAPVSSEEIISSSDITSSEEVSSLDETSSVSSDVDAKPDEPADNNWIWYVVIGGIAVLILAAVVVQYVLMEKKRKAE